MSEAHFLCLTVERAGHVLAANPICIGTGYS